MSETDNTRDEIDLSQEEEIENGIVQIGITKKGEKIPVVVINKLIKSPERFLASGTIVKNNMMRLPKGVSKEFTFKAGDTIVFLEVGGNLMVVHSDKLRVMSTNE